MTTHTESQCGEIQSGGGIGRRAIRDFSAYRRGIQNEKYTGSNPVLTAKENTVFVATKMGLSCRTENAFPIRDNIKNYSFICIVIGMK